MGAGDRPHESGPSAHGDLALTTRTLDLDLQGTYDPSWAQAAFHASDKPIILVMGGWRSGKTLAVARHVVTLGFLHPGARFFAGRFKEERVNDAMAPNIVEVLNDLDRFNHRRIPPEVAEFVGCKDFETDDDHLLYRLNIPAGAHLTGEIVTMSWLLSHDVQPVDVLEGESLLVDWAKTDMTMALRFGTTIKFGHLQEVERNFGSTEYSCIWVDEASTDIDHKGFLYFIGRGTYRVKTPQKIILSTNPPDEEHWLHKEFVDESRDDRATYEIPLESNKALMVRDPTYIVGLRKNLPPDWVRRFVDGTWASLIEGEAVYGGYYRETMGEHPETIPWNLSRGPIPWVKSQPILRGWDFSTFYTGVVWDAVSSTGQLRALKAELFTGLSGSDVVKEVIRMTHERFPGAGCLDYVDPAAFSLEPSELGSCVQAMSKSGNDLNPIGGAPLWVDRREATQQLLSRHVGDGPAFLISREPDTILLQKGFAGGYHYPTDKRTGVVKRDKPEKNTLSHIMEAHEYLVTGHLFSFRTSPWRAPKRLGASYV